MDIAAALKKMQTHPGIQNAGMILTHLGMVRSFNLAGETVTSLGIAVDLEVCENIRREFLAKPGIVDIAIEMNTGLLKPGDPIMLVAVAGDTRDHVFPALQGIIERLKKDASKKTETVA